MRLTVWLPNGLRLTLEAAWVDADARRARLLHLAPGDTPMPCFGCGGECPARWLDPDGLCPSCALAVGPWDGEA